MSREIAKHFCKIGKSETSCLIEHTVEIIESKAKLKTLITLLPVRRLYKEGDALVDDEYLTYEMLEDDLL
jgi:hypothetical protein